MRLGAPESARGHRQKMEGPAMAQDKFQVEKYSTDFVPHAERYGKARNLFSLWFAINMNILTIATGAISVALGLPLLWAVVAAIIGHALGAIFMGLHSAQGPLLGIPQMIQSRAQFGYFGSIFPLLLVVLMYIGYFAVAGVLTGNAVASWFGWDVNISIILMNTLAAVIAIYGYRLLRASVTVLSWISGIAFLVLTIGLLARNDLTPALAQGEFSWGTFLLAVTLAATWQLTYAPYAADYSRYLPANTTIRASFWWAYLGSATSSIWMFAFGAAAAAMAADSFAGGSVSFVVEQAGFAPWIFLLVIGAGNVVIMGIDVYGAFMTTTTISGALRNSKAVSRGGRVFTMSAIAAAGTVLAIAGRGDFLNNLMNFIVLLTVILVPWTAINLVDFYLVRKGQYVLAAIYDRKGRYRGVDWRAMTAYAIGVLSEIPFMSTPVFTGWLVEPLGGGNISWLVGVLFAGGSYYYLMRRYPKRHGYLPVPTSQADDPADRRESAAR